MKHTLPAIVVAVGIAVSGAFVALNETFAQGAASPPAAGVPQVGTQEAVAEGKSEEKALTVNVFERDGTKIVSLRHSSAQSAENYLLTEADEINVTSIWISNGRFTTGVANRGGAAIAPGGAAEQPWFYIPFDGYAGLQQAFPTPLPLREGSYVVIEVPGGNSDGWTEMYLIGRAPVTSDKLLIQ